MRMLKHNWKWKVISLLIGFFLWSYVTAGVNPAQQMVLRDVPVEIRNQQMLEQKGLVITRLEPKNVTATVTGKRNTLGSMEADEIRPVIDVAALEEGTQSVSIRYERPSEVMVEPSSTETISLTVERMMKKTMNITVNQEGRLPDGYLLESQLISPQSIEISGPRTRIDSVEKIVANVDVSSLTEDRSSNVEIIPVDAEGTKVEGVELSLSSVNIAFSVAQQKELPIVVEEAGEASDSILIDRIQVSPNTILVKGKKSVLEGIKEIKTQTIDRGQITDSTQGKVELIFPDGVSPMAGSKEVALTVTVEKKQDKRIEVPYSDIEIKNTGQGLDAKLGNPNGVLTVVANGFPRDLEKLAQDDIQVTLDLSGVSPGTVKVKPTVTLPKAFLLLSTNPAEIELSVTEKSANSEGEREKSD